MRVTLGLSVNGMEGRERETLYSQDGFEMSWASARMGSQTRGGETLHHAATRLMKQMAGRKAAGCQHSSRTPAIGEVSETDEVVAVGVDVETPWTRRRNPTKINDATEAALALRLIVVTERGESKQCELQIRNATTYQTTAKVRPQIRTWPDRRIRLPSLSLSVS